MNTIHYLEHHLNATNIKSYINPANHIGTLSFEINGVIIDAQFDIDNNGIYAIQIEGGLEDLKTITKTSTNNPIQY